MSDRINRAVEWLMAFLLGLMTLVTGIAIAGRFLFAYSLFWSDEVTRFLLIWIAFLGMSVGVRRGAHPGIDTVTRALSPQTARIVLCLAAILSLLFFLVMTIYGSLLAANAWMQRSPGLGLRMSLPYLAVPAAGLLMCLHSSAVWGRDELAGRDGGRNG
jgi:TRAP-type C4-dicarboxylate transport system permease small subunit